MIIDVEEWAQRIQEALDQILPNKQLKVDEHVKCLTGMIKDSLDRRGISDEAARQAEIRQIIGEHAALEPTARPKILDPLAQ